jgi:threonine dehydrogenase-like Zn-dependent dehydrogenase
MKAVVFHGVGDVRLDVVPDPKIREPNDAIVRITASAVCGTDLHMVRGTMPDMVPGTILGHEGVGVIEEVGKGVRNFKRGDRVVIPSTIGCGSCSYCLSGYYAQCDHANPNGPAAGTSFFGGPKSTGPFDGLQAEYARVPFANVGLVKVPDDMTDDQAILLSDIFPTGYFAADLAEITYGDTVAVFGCGPVGLFAIASAKVLGAGRVLAVDRVPSRLAMANDLGAEVIDFEQDDPVEAIRDLTMGIGAARVIDAVGVDAERPHAGPAADESAQRGEGDAGKEAGGDDEQWRPGDAPEQVLEWAVAAAAKAGTLSIVGVYPQPMKRFPIGAAMNKNLTMQMGNCNHRRYLPELLELVETGSIDPAQVLTQREPLSSAIEAYKMFDRRSPGWIKVELTPSGGRERRSAA